MQLYSDVEKMLKLVSVFDTLLAVLLALPLGWNLMLDPFLIICMLIQITKD